MILAFDTYYFDNQAKTVGIAFNNWSDTDPESFFEETIEGIAAYEPGAFYKRELPCILSLLKKINAWKIEAIIVDGFVFLDDDGKLGLGGHLYNRLDGAIPVIGVAKSKFHGIVNNCIQLLRGESKNPLYITAIGIPLENAVQCIKLMHGTFRMPYLLQLLDARTKAAANNIA